MEELEFVIFSNNSQCLWSTTSTGDWEKDFEQGRVYAIQYIRALRQEKCTPYFLTEIVKDMPKVKSTVEHGFFTELTSHLM